MAGLRRPAPSWVQAADLATLALLVLSVAVFVTGGWRGTLADIRISVQSGWRVLFWAVLLSALRHAVWREASLLHRLRAVAGDATRVAASSARHATGAARALLAVPARELLSLRPGLSGGVAVARQSWPVMAAATILVLARSFVFTFYDQAAFNSDHAIVGLMAKHLAEGRAFPLFFYGQSYMLGVEAWLAAPVFLVAGPSVLALQLPLVVINVVVAWLLIVLLQRQADLTALAAFAASLVFVLAPPATALTLVEANGGSVEPFLYVLLLWVLRSRPALFGLTLGVGFLHREFTIYGLVAIVALRLAERGPLARAGVREAGVAAGWFVATWGLVQALKPWSSPFGPGSSPASGSLSSTNIQEMLARICWAGDAAWPRLLALWHRHLDVLFGTGPHSLGFLGVRSRTAGQGALGFGPAMLIVLAAAFLRLAVGAARARLSFKVSPFAAYLLLVGAISVGVYALAACERVGSQSLRYNLLALLLPVGFAAVFFGIERSRAWRGAALLAVALWGGVSAFGHYRLLEEYLGHPPADEARQAADALVARGVRHATADYWVAYRLTFLAKERVLIASEGPVRIVEYQDTKGSPPLFIRERGCDGGVQLAGHFHACPK